MSDTRKEKCPECGKPTEYFNAGTMGPGEQFLMIPYKCPCQTDRPPAAQEPDQATVNRADLEAAAEALQTIFDEFADTRDGIKTYGPPDKAIARVHSVSRQALVRLRAALNQEEQ